MATAKSPGPGLHHLSWAVRSIDEVGHGVSIYVEVSAEAAVNTPTGETWTYSWRGSVKIGFTFE